jgi:hypothetical protein
MIQIKKISFKNFIPYYGIKEFNFGDSLGTSIIFGDNNTGKTSFINGIRFLFFDFLKNNPDDPNFKAKLSMNKIAYENSDYSFYAYMEFLYNNNTYKLKREYRINPKVIGEPASDNDFTNTITLIENGMYLSDKQIKEIIEKIIPEDISEFMLFDGENIEKYIEILNNDSSSGKENRKVKEAINKIIGTPYIDKIIARLNLLKGETNQQIERLISKQVSDKEKKDELEKLNSVLRSKITDKDETKAKLEDTKNRLEKIDSDLKENGRKVSIFNDLTQKENDLIAINSNIEQRKRDIKKLLYESVESMQYDKINELLIESGKKILSIQNKHLEAEALCQELKKYKDLFGNSVCSYCGSQISSEKSNQYRTQIDSIQGQIKEKSLNFDEKKKLEDFENKKRELNAILSKTSRFNVERIMDCQEDIFVLTTDKCSKNNEIKQIKDELSGDESNIKQFFKNLFVEQSKLEKLRDEYSKNIEAIDGEIDRTNNKIVSITKKITPTTDVKYIQDELQLLTKIGESFNDAKESFIVSMREKVQKSSSEIFLKFIDKQNTDIKEIHINENYRMKIVMKDDSVMPIPGSGYNTLLALSLIFGLNNNSQLFGTIFFDAAFSVLQNSYTNNIIKTFNDIAPELILLIHNDKIDMNKTREILGSKLVKEIEIYQDGNSFNTKIREV